MDLQPEVDKLQNHNVGFLIMQPGWFWSYAGGNTRGESKHSAAKNNSPHQNLLVYADVGRAVTSLMQKFTQPPDSNRSMSVIMWIYACYATVHSLLLHLLWRSACFFGGKYFQFTFFLTPRISQGAQQGRNHRGSGQALSSLFSFRPALRCY